MGWAIGILLLVLLCGFFWAIFYLVGRMFCWLRHAKDPFPGLDPFQAFVIYRLFTAAQSDREGQSAKERVGDGWP